nr:retrotransposon protein, putative, Ty1-copia subclass [Tanacetum cinerariifolium]
MGYISATHPRTVLVARNTEFLENSLINQEASRSLEDLEIIQEEDTHPSLNTSLNHEEDDLEIDEPQSDIVPIRRCTRTRHAPDRMCLYIDAKEHELGDLGEPVNYKAALLDLESEKWLNAMNVEMQSMKDNEVWVLVELPLNGKTVGSEAAYILGIKIYRDRLKRLIGFCQSAYIKKILKRYCMENSKRGSIPMQEKLKLSKSQGASTPAELKRLQNVPYASAIGFIMYAVRCTCPDVAFAQNKSAKQSIFATSSVEAEYIDAFDASKDD